MELAGHDKDVMGFTVRQDQKLISPCTACTSAGDLIILNAPPPIWSGRIKPYDKKLLGQMNVLYKEESSGSGPPAGESGNGMWFPELVPLLGPFVFLGIQI